MPALETPVAPASPTPAPAALTPSPSPSPAPAAPQPSGSDDPFERKLQSTLGADVSDPTPEPQPKPAEVKKPESKPAVTPTLKADAATTQPKPTGPKELREELERVRTEAKTHAAKVSEYETKIADYERRGKDSEALKARLEQIEKAHNESQSELRALKREASPEFKKQYEEPFTRAAGQAERLMKRIQKPDGTPATFDEFVSIYQTSKVNYGRAAAEARELFGDDQSPVIMDQVRELDRLETAKTEAMEAEKKGWEERAKAEEGRKVQQRETDAKNFQQINEDLKNSVDDYRDPADDAELATARAEAASLYHSQPRSKEEHMVKLAHIQHRLGAYGAQKLQIARATARIAELEAKLEETKTRQPGADPQRPGGGAITQPEESFEEAALSGKWKMDR